MPREDIHDRGRRLLVEGRVRLVQVRPGRIDADVRGDSAQVHQIRWLDGAGWGCTCPARTRCAHVVAVQLVVVTDQETSS